MPAQISGSVALVTGANRGLGQVYARELVRRGAAKVYGGARNPAAVTEPGVIPVPLDITDAGQVAAAAAACADVTLLVNNAGVMKASTFIGPPDPDAARQEMAVNYFGTLSMCRAFAPVLAGSGGGAIVNMLSVASFYTNPFTASYGASKAAAWSLTNGLRVELHHQGTWLSRFTRHLSIRIWRRGSTCPRSARRRWRSRPSTRSRPARSRCSPTSGAGSSRRRCPGTTS
jgi:NAD(P)-dependent dehydrogenase (short-subunit alcohol dehydrogenase family)